MPTPVAVGLDIGNHKCAISIIHDGIVDHQCSRETPTVVHFASDHRVFGTEATHLSTIDSDSTVSQIKRIVGRRFDSADFQNDRRRFAYATEKAPDAGVAVKLPHYLGKEQKFTGLEILTMLMSHLKQIAELVIGSPVSSCVIGVPALFSTQQKNAFRDAAEIAGWRPLELLEEGRAAGMQYAIQRSSSASANIVLVDVGHCNTQVTVLCLDGPKMTVLAEVCDRNLGGRDFDEVLFEHLAGAFKEQYKVDAHSNAKASAKLRTACENAKRVLSESTEAEIDCLVDEIDMKGMITREMFEGLSCELLDRIKLKVDEGLKRANLDVRDIHSVELIGSGSWVPLIPRTLNEIFSCGVSRTMNARECIACGCALRCEILLASNEASGNGYTDPRSMKNPNGINRKDWREAREKEMELAKQDKMVEEAEGRRKSLEAFIRNLRNEVLQDKNIDQSELEKNSTKLKEMEEWVSEKQNLITESEYDDKIKEMTKMMHRIDDDGNGRVNDDGGAALIRKRKGKQIVVHENQV